MLEQFIEILKLVPKDLAGTVIAVFIILFLLLRYMKTKDCEWHETLRESSESVKAVAESLSELKGLMEALIPFIIKSLGGEEGGRDGD